MFPETFPFHISVVFSSYGWEFDMSYISAVYAAAAVNSLKANHQACLSLIDPHQDSPPTTFKSAAHFSQQ